MTAPKHIGPKSLITGQFVAHNFQDLTGRKINKWLVLRQTENYRHKYSMWVCRCECGREKVLRACNLTNGISRSCRSCAPKRSGFKNLKAQKPDAAFNSVFAIYRWQAKKADRDFLLTREEFKILTQQPCFYCGDPPSNIKKSHAGNYFVYNGVDRVENSQGYRMDNVVPCCHTCNAMKQEFAQGILFEKVAKIYKRHRTMLEDIL